MQCRGKRPTALSRSRSLHRPINFKDNEKKNYVVRKPIAIKKLCEFFLTTTLKDRFYFSL